MLARPYSAAVGRNLYGMAVGAGALIAGVRINNPTGSWLHLLDVDAYVPPYTLGWATSFAPAKLQLSVEFSNSPSGQVSDLRGSPISVIVQDYPATPSAGVPVPGQDSGAQAEAPKAAALYLRAYTGQLNATDTEQFATLIAAGAEPRIVMPLRLELRAVIDQTRIVRGQVRMSWYYTPPLGARTGITSLVVSPDHPTDKDTALPRIEIPGSSLIEVGYKGEDDVAADGSTQAVDGLMYYYPLAAGS